jgi:hypothetical protein
VTPIPQRPEAGYLPISASGRLFAWRRSGDRVMLRRRAPREVYRVYDEDEFLDGAGDEEFFEPVEPVKPVKPVEPVKLGEPAASAGTGERRLRRLAGAAMLVGAVGTVGGAIAINISRPARGAARRTSPSSPVATRSYITTMTRASASVHPSAAGHHVSSAQAPPSHPVAHASHGGGGRRRAGRKDVAWRGHARGARRNAAVGQGLATPAMLARSEVSVSEPAAPPRAEHAEFGFER